MMGIRQGITAHDRCLFEFGNLPLVRPRSPATFEQRADGTIGIPSKEAKMAGYVDERGDRVPADDTSKTVRVSGVESR